MGGPKQATQSPIVTGTSVIALKFKDGVVMAADNLGSSFPPNPTPIYLFHLLTSSIQHPTAP